MVQDGFVQLKASSENAMFPTLQSMLRRAAVEYKERYIAVLYNNIFIHYEMDSVHYATKALGLWFCNRPFSCKLAAWLPQ